MISQTIDRVLLVLLMAYSAGLTSFAVLQTRKARRLICVAKKESGEYWSRSWPPVAPRESETGGPLDSEHDIMPTVADQPAMMALIAFADVMRTPHFRQAARRPVLGLLTVAIKMREHFIETIRPPAGAIHQAALDEIINRERVRLRDYRSALNAWYGATEKDLYQIEWHANRLPLFKGEFNDID